MQAVDHQWHVFFVHANNIFGAQQVVAQKMNQFFVSGQEFGYDADLF